ncbi:MAG: hypothetical protein FWC47_01155 [Oscillospiraceae bacterium]|nr:hypothetical protein [Oscillospiraceae bacterium]
MSFKSKLDNFWYYYKYHTIIGIFVVLAVFFMIFTSRGNKSSDFNMVVFSMNNPIEDTNIQQDLDNIIVTDKNKKEVKINFLPYDISDPTSQTSATAIQALTVWLAVGDVDILIANEEAIKQYSVDEDGNNSFVFVPLNFINISSIKTIKDVDNEDIGLLVSDIPKFKGLDFYDKDLYLAVVSGGKYNDKAQKVIDYLLNVNN